MTLSSTPYISADSGLALLTFKIAPNQFDLNRGLAYISMRDQVLRARTLVHAAIGSGLFEQHPETGRSTADREVAVDLLVVGAGVGGISAALTAAEAGYRTLVLEKAPRCFPLLSSGTDRLLSTTLYDWPARHFDVHAFPALPGADIDLLDARSLLRFPSIPTPANELAQDLNQQVDAFLKKHSQTLHVECDMEIAVDDGITWAGGRRVKVDLPRPIELFGAPRQSLFARAVVYALGFGSEKVLLDGADIAASFWGYQSLEDDLKAVSGHRAAVQIIGGGDGGLQEALRFAFRPAYHDFAKAVAHLQTCVRRVNADRWDCGLRDIMFAEDNAARALMWGYRTDLVFAQLQRVHEEFVHELCQHASDALLIWRAEVGREQPLDVSLYDSHPFSARVYALNRFLFELLKQLTTIKPAPVTVHRETDAPPTGAAIVVKRHGIAPGSEAYGTSEKEDLLRRVLFRSLPNHYSVIA